MRMNRVLDTHRCAPIITRNSQLATRNSQLATRNSRADCVRINLFPNTHKFSQAITRTEQEYCFRAFFYNLRRF